MTPVVADQASRARSKVSPDHLVPGTGGDGHGDGKVAGYTPSGRYATWSKASSSWRWTTAAR